MPFRPDQIAGPELRWDIPHLIRQDANNTQGFIGQARLSPTAVNGGNWAICMLTNCQAMVWDILFSTDTALEVTIAVANASDPNFTNSGYGSIMRSGGANPAGKFEAQVAAAVAGTTLLGAFVAANSFTSLLGKSWLIAPPSNALVIHTSAVAANCWLTALWAEVNLP